MLPRSRSGRLASLLSCLAIVACEGAQQGYYDACAEPAGLVLGCETPDDEELTAWDACMKLTRCGVILMQDEDDDNPETSPIFERCVDRIEETFSAQGDTVLACIDGSQCPELVGVDPAEHPDDDPDASNPAIEGIIGFCGRLDPP